MHLSPREIDKLLLHNAGFLAQKRLARGVRLNYPEAVALIATQLLEFIRDGRRVAELMDLGRRFLGRRQVMDGVPAMVAEVQIEGTFPDGTKLVTVHHPIAALDGDLELYPSRELSPRPSAFEIRRARSEIPDDPCDQAGSGEIASRRARETVEIPSRMLEIARSRSIATLSFHRNQRLAEIQSLARLWQAAEYSRRHGSSLRAGRKQDGDACRNRRKQDHPRWK